MPYHYISISLVKIDNWIANLYMIYVSSGIAYDSDTSKSKTAAES